MLSPWGESDLAEVVGVLNAASPRDRFDHAYVGDAVFGDPDYASDLLVAAREGGRIVGAIAGVARRSRRDPPARLQGYVKLIAVAPAWQRRGIGSALLEAIERGLASAGAETVQIFGDAPAYLRPGVDFQLTALVCLLLGRGYSWGRHAVNMDVALATANLDSSAEEARLGERGITLRRLTSDDAAAFDAYLAREWSWNWRVEAGGTLRREPVSTHLAVCEGEIVGFASFNATGPGQFGPMGVRPDLRRLGIGAALLKRCLLDLRAQGYATADIQWVGPIGFYARHVGATLSRCFWQFQRPLG